MTTAEKEPAVTDAAIPIEISAEAKPSQSPGHVLLATWLGGVFDGMDSSIFAIVLFPALSELCKTTSHAEVGQYGSYIVALFMVGWACGAFIFGTLADYIGRAKTLTITILLYAICTGLCAFAHNWWELGIYRFLVGAGIGGEMGIGAVFLSECWPNKSRMKAVGLMATSLGCGYLLTASLNLFLGHTGWRNLFIAGIAPAFLTVYIRAKLKESDHFTEACAERKRVMAKAESERTAEEKDTVKLTILHLFSAANRKNIMLVSALACVAIICWWAVLAWIPAWVNQLTGDLAVEQRSHAMFAKDIGMILSGIVGGYLAQRFGYRRLMSISMIASFLIAVGMFMTMTTFQPALLVWILGLGFFAHIPFVILWMYIPELFPAQIRSTAFGFSYNIGRFGAAAAVLASGQLIHALNGSYAIAASIVSSVYIVGAVIALFMPKTRGQVT
jgi:MFS family permease